MEIKNYINIIHCVEIWKHVAVSLSDIKKYVVVSWNSDMKK
jgi:hypothetical protein